MAVIIGAGTTVTGDFTGVISANWDLNPSIQRLWELGSWTPYDVIRQAQQNVTLTVYAGGGPSIDLYPPSTDCIDSDATFDVVIIPASCVDSIQGPSGTFYLTSYSYSKGDVRGYGQQSYAGTQWQDDPVNGIEAPTVILKGISEGQYNGDLTLAEMGASEATVPGEPPIQGFTGSVSAGFPGLGQADITTFIIYDEVGLATAVGKKDGYIGTASASVPHTPLWLPV
jgi:hypothetical protein